MGQPTAHAGGGGAKAPDAGQPMIAPSLNRPDWPLPSYLRLPLWGKLGWAERYAERLRQENKREQTAGWGELIGHLTLYMDGKVDQIPENQLTAALNLIGQNCSHSDIFAACEIDEVPRRGNETFSAYDAKELVKKLSAVS